MTWANMQVPGLMEDRTIDPALDFFINRERGPYYGFLKMSPNSYDFIAKTGDPKWRFNGRCSG